MSDERRVQFVSRCLTCGADETDDPGVVVEREEPENPNPRSSLLKQSREEYECGECGETEVVDTSVLGQVSADKFGITSAPIEEEMGIRINGTEIQYAKAEAFVVETELYDRAGLSGAGRMRQVRIHAFRPPTLGKGNAYRVELGEHLDERLLLTGIRYYTSDDPWRLLSFSRKLDHGVIDKMDSIYAGVDRDE